MAKISDHRHQPAHDGSISAGFGLLAPMVITITKRALEPKPSTPLIRYGSIRSPGGEKRQHTGVCGATTRPHSYQRLARRQCIQAELTCGSQDYLSRITNIQNRRLVRNYDYRQCAAISAAQGSDNIGSESHISSSTWIKISIEIGGQLDIDSYKLNII